MTAGMPLREAQARWPHEPLLPLDTEATVRACEPVLRVLDTFSPFVEDTGPGQAYLDASGLERRYGPPGKLARSLRRAVTQATGFEPQVGVAGGKFVAGIAARTAGKSGVRVAPRGRALAALGRLPVAVLGLNQASLQRLRALGVRTLTQFGALPAASILHRYGPEGWRAYRGLHGTLTEPLKARRHPLLIHDLLDFEWVEHNPDRLLFACKMLTDRLAAQLARHHLACRSLHVRWSFEHGGRQQQHLRLAEPSAQAETLLRTLRWYLDGLELAQGIVGIRLRADELTDTTGWQLKLLIGPDARVPDLARRRRALDVIGRLRARWGDAVAWQAELTDARRPEHGFRRLEVTLPDPDGEPPSGPRVTVPFALLDPPKPVRVVDETAPRPFRRSPPPSRERTVVSASSLSLWERVRVRVDSPSAPAPAPSLPDSSNPPLPNREKAGVRVSPLSLRERARVRVDSPSAPAPTSPLPNSLQPPRPNREIACPELAEGAGASPLSLWERVRVRVQANGSPPSFARPEPVPRRVLVIDGHGHVVTCQAGPWRLHDTPWRDDAVERDYYQVESAGGAAFLLFHDRPSAQWYLQGVYD